MGICPSMIVYVHKFRDSVGMYVNGLSYKLHM